MTTTRTAKLSPTVGPTIGSEVRTGPRRFEKIVDEYDDGTYVTFSFELDASGTPVDGACATWTHGDEITWRDAN